MQAEHHRLGTHIPRVTGRDEAASEVKANDVPALDDRIVEGSILVVGSHRRPEHVMEKGAE
jgi:hypothetical protein